MFIHLRRREWDHCAVPLLITVLLTLLGTLPARGQTGTSAEEVKKICELRCTPPKAEPPFVEIDANTTAVLNGATNFAEGEKVKVIVSRKNPYKYDYETQIKSSSLDANLVSAFLSLIPGADAISSLFGQTGSVSPVPAPRAGAASGADECSSHRGDLNGMIALLNKLNESDEALKKEAGEIEASYKEYEKFVLTTDKDFLGTFERCVDICTQGSGVLSHLSRLTNLDKFKGEIEELQKAADDLGKTAAKFKEEHKDCFGTELAKVEKNVKAAAESAKAALAKVQQIQKAKPAIELLGQRIGKTLADNEAFFEEHFPYTQGGPIAVKINLFRKNLREENAKEKEVGQVDLTVGQSRFSLSAGVGFSTIEDVTIVKRGTEFAEENESDLRPSLVVMLNTQLGKFWKTIDKTKTPKVREVTRRSVGLATGLVLTSRDNSTEVEFIVGPSFGFLDDRFFIVLGYHTARVQSLRSKDIPAGTTDIPVDKDWKSGAMLAFTYKIR